MGPIDYVLLQIFTNKLSKNILLRCVKEMGAWTPIQQRLAAGLLASSEPVGAESLWLATKDREIVCYAMDLLNSEDWEILNLDFSETKKERFDPTHPDNIRSESTRSTLISVLEGVAGKSLAEILKGRDIGHEIHKWPTKEEVEEKYRKDKK